VLGTLRISLSRDRRPFFVCRCMFNNALCGKGESYTDVILLLVALQAPR
jgi:hypothetical protein